VIKILGLDYFYDAIEMVNIKEKAGGMSKPNIDEISTIFLKYFLGKETTIALGYFDDNDTNEKPKLVAWVSLSFIHKLNIKFTNTWNISGLFTSKFENIFSFNRPEIGELIKTAFEIAEHRHCWTYYYTIASKHQVLYDKLWKKNNFLPTGRYKTEIEKIVCTDDYAIKEYYRPIIGNREYKEEFVIKRRTLNPEFRIKYDNLHQLELGAEHKSYPEYTQFNFDYAGVLLNAKTKILNIR